MSKSCMSYHETEEDGKKFLKMLYFHIIQYKYNVPNV